ncbi:Uncharacterized protein Rs2_09129 [Raphanus sativus]|nr:Uncharacterized protein Rs2_09129 [Raphanus sativus]
MSQRRYTTAEKGKGLAQKDADASHRRIRAPSFDNSALIQRNLQTLIGHLTNPRYQSIPQLLEELSCSWTLKGVAMGSDLGHDRFQFRFDREDDILSVLSNRPYQLNGWMIILQRWEPIISPDFPSQIPFWIDIKGVPLHFWHEKVIYNMGLDLGTLDDYAITQTAMRMRVSLNGLQPITLDTIVDFDTGEEAPVTLEYEGLQNICSVCNCLTHYAKDCPENPRREMPPSRDLAARPSFELDNSRHPPRRETRYQPYPSNRRQDVSTQEGEYQRRLDRHGRPFGERISQSRETARPLRNKITPAPLARTQRTATDGASHTEKDQILEPMRQNTRNLVDYRDISNHYESQMIWREKKKAQQPPLVEDNSGDPSTPAPDFNHQSTGHVRSLERNLAISDFPHATGIPSREEVLQELVDVTIQYTNCPDPVEREARRQRVLQSNAEGIMEKTADSIIAAASIAVLKETQVVLPEMNEPILLPGPGMELPKRRGRPPKEKRQTPKTKTLIGVGSRKRHLTASRTSPASRNSPARHASSTPRQGQASSSNVRNTPQTKDGRPNTVLIPASVKPQKDFHTQEPPLP